MRTASLAILTMTLCTLAACGHATPGGTPALATQQAATQPSTSQGATANAAAAAGPTPGTSATPAASAFVCDNSTPLSADDIALYLSVMREAAGIVQHPTAADLAERQRAKTQAAANRNAIAADQQSNGEARASADAANQKFLAATQAAQKSGDYSAVAAAANAAKVANATLSTKPVIMPPEQSPAQQAESMRVMEMDDGTADEVIVDQRHIDSDRWDCITRKVEAAIPPPGEAYGDGDPIVMTAQQRLEEAKYEAQVAANKRQLAAYRAEILSLEKIVRARHTDN